MGFQRGCVPLAGSGAAPQQGVGRRPTPKRAPQGDESKNSPADCFSRGDALQERASPCGSSQLICPRNYSARDDNAFLFGRTECVPTNKMPVVTISQNFDRIICKVLQSKFCQSLHLPSIYGIIIIVERTLNRARLQKICEEAEGCCRSGREFPWSMSDFKPGEWDNEHSSC